LHNAPEEDAIHLFPTASLANFILPQDWHNLEQGDGKLTQFIRPKNTKKLNIYYFYPSKLT